MDGEQLILIGFPKGRFNQRSSILTKRMANYHLREIQYPVKIRLPTGRLAKIYLLRPRDIAFLLSRQRLDIGITCDEWTKEFEHNSRYAKDTGWCSTRLSMIGPKNLQLNFAKEFDDRTYSIATPFPNIARSYIEKKGYNMDIFHVYGTTESLLSEICEIALDCVETGKTIRNHGLTCLDVLFNSETRLHANRYIDDAKSISELL